MQIIRDKIRMKLCLSQQQYLGKVLEKFNMVDAKPLDAPLSSHLKLTTKQCPISIEANAKMSKISYASAVGSLIYAMVGTCLDIAHLVGVVSRFLANLGKEHWNEIKWILRYIRGLIDYYLCF